MKKFFKSGDTVLFYGDSVTDVGRNRADGEDLGFGYPLKVKAIYDQIFPDNGVRFLNRGISGNRTKDLLARYEEDCLALKPDFISILIGVNDAWRKYDSDDETSPEQFEKNYRTLLENIKRDLPDTKIMMIEPYVLFTLPERVIFHETLDPFNVIERKLGREFADYYVSLEGAFARHVAEGCTDEELSADGVHPTPFGHGVIAYEYLKAIGIL